MLRILAIERELLSLGISHETFLSVEFGHVPGVLDLPELALRLIALCILIEREIAVAMTFVVGGDCEM